jgi:hypothetical protein
MTKRKSQNRDNTGRIGLGIGDNKIDSLGDLTHTGFVGNIKTPEGKYLSAMILWSPANFAMFAFDLIAMMNGTFRKDFVSSFHGMPFPVKNSK